MSMISFFADGTATAGRHDLTSWVALHEKGGSSLLLHMPPAVAEATARAFNAAMAAHRAAEQENVG